MTEDILEQLVAGWFMRKQSTFVKHNVKYKPDKNNLSKLTTRDKSRYNVSSDIDVLAIHLNEKREKRVSIVSCKSWQDGFDVDLFYDYLIDENKRKLRIGSGEIWKKFRELVEPIWSQSFREAIFKQTNSNDFTYYIAITKFKNINSKKLELFKNCEFFLNNLSDNGKHRVKIEFLTLENMIEQLLNEPHVTTLESSEIGRFIQLIKAAGLKLSK